MCHCAQEADCPKFGCLVTENVTEMVRSKTRDFFARTISEAEMKETHENKVVKVAENRVGYVAKQIWLYQSGTRNIIITEVNHGDRKGVTLPTQDG